MENRIAIKEINLVNFKGLKNQKIKFNHVTSIYGDNGVGKTTIFDAFTWLLFGKDSTDRKDFEIKTLDSRNNVIPKIDHKVSAVITVNNEEIEIKRILREKWVKKRGSLEAEFTGNETVYFWNEVPMLAKEFSDKISSILDESIFKMITNPLAFASLKWQKQRDVLIEIVGNVSDEEIAGSNKDFLTLLDKLSNKSLEDLKKQTAAQRKKLNDEIKSIPTRIDEVNRNIPDVLDFGALQAQKETLEKEEQNIQNQIDDKNKSYQAVLEQKNKISNEIFSLKSKLQNIEFETKQQIQSIRRNESSEVDQLKRDLQTKQFELSSANNDLNSLQSQLNSLQTQLKGIISKMDEKREAWNTENAKELKFDDSDFACPTCKRDFEASKIESKKIELKSSFDKNKSALLNQISNEGISLSKQKEATEKSIDTIKDRIKKTQTEVSKKSKEIESIQIAIKTASEKNSSKVPLSVEEELKLTILKNKEYQDIKNQIELKEKESEDVLPVNNDELITKKSEITSKINQINSQLAIQDQIKRGNQRVEELEKEESNLAKQISEIEKQQFIIEEFNKKKVDTLESLINDKFSHVKFKLFDTQINGAQVECCEALINGVPFSDANTASKINAGLDIINTLCEYYKITAPIFIDNRESIVEIIDCESQIINLIVSNSDKSLRVA